MQLTLSMSKLNMKRNCAQSFKPVSCHAGFWEDEYSHVGSSCVLHLSAYNLSPVLCNCSQRELNLQEPAQ